MFCLGSFLFGVFFAFSQYYRFAAAEIATDDYRSRAISLVIAGGVVAGFAGPWIAASTRLVVAHAEFAGSYAAMLWVLSAERPHSRLHPLPGRRGNGKRAIPLPPDPFRWSPASRRTWWPCWPRWSPTGR